MPDKQRLVMDRPLSECSLSDVAGRAWEFGVFAALSMTLGTRAAAEWYRSAGADLDTALAALEATPREWWNVSKRRSP